MFSIGLFSNKVMQWAVFGSLLVLLATVAFLLPWATRRPVYCAQICPHGMLQEQLGRMGGRKWRLPPGLVTGLTWLPGLLLLLVMLMPYYRKTFDANAAVTQMRVSASQTLARVQSLEEEAVLYRGEAEGAEREASRLNALASTLEDQARA